MRKAHSASPEAFIDQLASLVEIDSVSPLPESAACRIDDFVGAWNFRRMGQFWVRTQPDSDVWVYSHIDTKPVGDYDSWQSPPFELIRIEDKLYGRGVSDAKFQLLNALHAFDGQPVNMIIDGAEECEGTEAGAYLAHSKVRKLVVVDGSAEDPCQIYGGLSGQLDGNLTLDTGFEPAHPGRTSRTEALRRLSALQDEMASQHFNVTRIRGGDPQRSLTLEQIEVGFDLRFGPEDQAAVEAFRSRQQIEIRQYYPPVFGTESLKRRPIAPFSNPLGMRISTFEAVWVLPGGRADNCAHRPNECIALKQISEHRALLEGFIQAGLEVLPAEAVFS